MTIYIIIIGFMLLSWLVGSTLRRRFTQYSKIPNSSGLSGKEIAEKMLSDHGISDVQVISVQGSLTDHYNPMKKTVNLSPEVFSGRSVAAAAVSAHECGHAVQHATAYSWLQFRSALVPIVSFSSNIIQWVLLGGIIMVQTMPWLLGFGIILFALTTIFSIITLPVEFDASNRALAWLGQSRITLGVEQDKAKNALKWAAMTYVIAALSSIATLLYYVMIFLGARDRN